MFTYSRKFALNISFLPKQTMNKLFKYKFGSIKTDENELEIMVETAHTRLFATNYEN